jgi:hypothetical protein
VDNVVEKDLKAGARPARVSRRIELVKKTSSLVNPIFINELRTLTRAAREHCTPSARRGEAALARDADCEQDRSGFPTGA